MYRSNSAGIELLEHSDKVTAFAITLSPCSVTQHDKGLTCEGSGISACSFVISMIGGNNIID